MKKFISVVSFVFSSTFLLSQGSENPEYIRLTYGGPRFDRFIGDIFFHYDKDISMISAYGLSFKIHKKDFYAIKSVLLNSKVLTSVDSSTITYYKFSIVSNSREIAFEAIDHKKVFIIFNQIIFNIRKSKIRYKIDNALKSTYIDILGPQAVKK